MKITYTREFEQSALYIEFFLHVGSYMATSSDSQDSRGTKQSRFTFQVPFKTVGEKEAFIRRFEAVCKLLNSAGAPPLDNHGLMSTMLDVVERNVQSFSLRNSHKQPQSFLSNNGEKEVIHATCLLIQVVFRGCMWVVSVQKTRPCSLLRSAASQTW